MRKNGINNVFNIFKPNIRKDYITDLQHRFKHSLAGLLCCKTPKITHLATTQTISSSTVADWPFHLDNAFSHDESRVGI